MRVERLSIWLMLFAAPAVSCSNELQPVDGDADTDADADGDADADTDADTDADPWCNADWSGNLPSPSGVCMTDNIGCGDVIEGTTEGGSTYYENTHYLAWFCRGRWDTADTDWSASERVFQYIADAPSSATFTLEACGDLALRSVSTGDECPSSAYSKSCEASAWATQWDHSTQTLEVQNPADSPRRLEIVVDGLDGYEGNFRLTVQCQ